MNGKLHSILKGAGLGNTLSTSPVNQPDIEANIFTNFVNNIKQRTHALATTESVKDCFNVEVKKESVEWVLNKYVDGKVTESVDVTSMILVFQNVAFNPVDTKFDWDIADVQETSPVQFSTPDGSSLELIQVKLTNLQSTGNGSLIESKRLKLSELEAKLDSLILIRQNLKSQASRTSDQHRQLSSTRTDINRCRSNIRALKLSIAKIEGLSP